MTWTSNSHTAIKGAMMNITLYNDFHNSETTVRVTGLPATLTHAQVLRACKKLCGMHDCKCQDIYGVRRVDGRQIYMEWDFGKDGETLINLEWAYPEGMEGQQ
jgi:hypothetical protein